MALAAENPNDRAEQLLVLSQKLTALLERETSLFVARTPQKAASFAEEKARLAQVYRKETMRIAKNPDLIATANAKIKSELRAATVSFNKALEENYKANATIRTITEGMVKSVAKEVAGNRVAKSGYGADGGNASPAGAMSAITLNQVV